MQHEAIRTPQAHDRGQENRLLPARPRIVVAGEFGAGKSSVINAMMRRSFLPYNIGATNRPLISLYHAEDTGIVVTPWTGDEFELPTFDGIADPNDVQGLAIRTPMAGLEGSEIVELPFHHDGVVDDGVIEVMASADLLIWVTIASQAWRLTEKSVLQRLPKVCQARAVLAVSRTDKLRSAEDRAKIERRIRRETPEIFREIVFMKASSARLAQTASDDTAWDVSGGARIMAIAHDTLGDAVRLQRDVPDHARAKPLDPPANEDKATGEVLPFEREPQPTPLPRPQPADKVPRAGVPVFVRSQRGPAATPAETSSQHVRDAVARGHGGRAAKEVTQQIEGILRETHGLDAAGIGNFREVQVIKSFRSTAGTSVDAMVLATAICLNSAASATEFVVPDDHIEEVMVNIGPQTFLMVPIDCAVGTFAFFVVQSKRVNPSIMRVLLRRVVALWSEARN